MTPSEACAFILLKAGTCGTEALDISIITLVCCRDTAAHNERV